MILPEEYLFVNEVDNNYKPISLLNSEKNYKITSPLFESQNQFIEQRIEQDDQVFAKRELSQEGRRQQRNHPNQQLNNYTDNGNYYKQQTSQQQQQQEFFQISPQRETSSFQKIGELSILSFDSQQEEIQPFQERGDYIFESNEDAVLTRRSGLNFLQERDFFQDEADNDIAIKDYDQFYQTNEFPKKKKKNRKGSASRRESMQKRYETIQRIYTKEMGQTSGSGWFQGSTSKNSQDNTNSSIKNNRIYMQGQKPFSSSIQQNSNIKQLSSTNGFQNYDHQQKAKKRVLDIKPKGQQQQQSIEAIKLRMKPPQSANLYSNKSNNSNNIQTMKNYRDIIMQRPNTRQIEFSQQNSINSHPSTQLTQTPKINQKVSNQQLSNTQSAFNHQFSQDEPFKQGSQDGAFSFQNVFQLIGQREVLLSPRSSIQDGFEQRDADFEQLVIDHNVYVSSSITSTQQNLLPLNLKYDYDEKKSLNGISKAVTSATRPFSKERARKEGFKHSQQNTKSIKKEEIIPDSANKVVAKNKKRTIFKINPQPQTGLSLAPLQSQGGGGGQLSQQNSVNYNCEELENEPSQSINITEQQSPVEYKIQSNIDETDRQAQNGERDIPQKENLQTKYNMINTQMAKKNNYLKSINDQITSPTPSISAQNSRITSLQATVVANRNITSANRQTSKPKSSAVNSSDQNLYSLSSQQTTNLASTLNPNETSDKKNKKKQKGNAISSLASTVQVVQTQRVFSMNSQDEYIRRTLIKMGWKENKIPQTTLFDLKWIYIDSNDDYKLLTDNQYYNHFKNNTELTQKGRLLYNLKNNTQFGVNSESFFPRCYDLGNDPERQEFTSEYNKHIQYVKLRRRETYLEIKRAYQIKQNNKLNAQVNNGVMFRKGNKPKFISPLLFEDQKRDLKFLVNTSILAEAVELLRKIKKQQEDYLDETRLSKEYQANYNPSSAFKLNSMIQQYVKIEVPFDEEKYLYDKIIGMTKEYWQTPSLKLMTKLYSLYTFFKDADPQFKVSGTKNIWIIKPSANSRGSGIYLVDKLEEAIDSGLKMQARIVQKYIERPLIFVGDKYKKLNNKKFDIRQWVLVTNMKPLKIYFFTSSYLRICSQSYDMNNIKNLSKHLTNFSVNKNNINKENWDETVVELKQFIAYLKEYKNIDYQEDVKPQIKGLIIETIKCAQDKIVPRKNSFELYGFDILIDEYAHPWLLEVNLSPACSERTPFLTEMLDAMAQKMFKIVLKQPNDNIIIAIQEELEQDINIPKDDLTTQPLLNTDYEWEEIYNEVDSEDFQDEANEPSLAINNDIQLMIIGQKADIRKEKNLDKKYFQYWGAIKIQSKWRQYMAWKELIKLRKTKYSIIIQKNVRVLIARRKLKFLRENKASTKLQAMWRRKMSMNKLKMKKKNKIITKLQVLYKIKKAKQVLKQLKENKCATIVQTKFRQFKAKQLFNQKKYFKNCAVSIQKFYKKRYQSKENSATQIKSFYKMKTALSAYKTMKRQHYAAIKIQSNYRRHRAQVIKQKLRLCSIVKRIYFHSKKVLLTQLTQKVAIYPLAKILTRIFHSKLKLVCLKKIFNIGIMRIRAAVRIQGLMKIKRAKRQKKRMYRLSLLIKLQRRVKAYLLRLKFLRYMKKEYLSGITIMYFLKECVAKSKLLSLRYQDMKAKQQNQNNFQEEQPNWLYKTSYSSQRPQSQTKQRSKMQRPPSHIEQRNINSSSSSRREAQLQKIEMQQTKHGFNNFNYLKETQSRQNQIAITSIQKQQNQPQQQNQTLLRHNSQNMIINQNRNTNQKIQSYQKVNMNSKSNFNQQFKLESEDLNINEIIKNYTLQDDSPVRVSTSYNQNGKVISSKSTQHIKSQNIQSKQQQQYKQQSIPSRQIIIQNTYSKPNSNVNFYDNSTKKFRLNQDIVKELEKNLAKIQNNGKQASNHQVSSTLTNFQRF